MIAAGYSLDLYCDNESLPRVGEPEPGQHGYREFPHTFYAETWDECVKQARARGWFVSRGGFSGSREAICPRCNKLNPRPVVSERKHKATERQRYLDLIRDLAACVRSEGSGGTMAYNDVLSILGRADRALGRAGSKAVPFVMPEGKPLVSVMTAKPSEFHPPSPKPENDK